jgi:hypothetical protein
VDFLDAIKKASAGYIAEVAELYKKGFQCLYCNAFIVEVVELYKKHPDCFIGEIRELYKKHGDKSRWRILKVGMLNVPPNCTT